MTTSTAGVKLTSAISGAKTTFISEPRVGVQVRCFISLPFESTEMLCLIFGFFAAFDLNRSLSKIKHWPPHSVSYIIWRTSKKCCLNSIGWSSGTNSDIFFNAFLIPSKDENGLVNFSNEFTQCGLSSQDSNNSFLSSFPDFSWERTHEFLY